MDIFKSKYYTRTLISDKKDRKPRVGDIFIEYGGLVKWYKGKVVEVDMECVGVDQISAEKVWGRPLDYMVKAEVLYFYREEGVHEEPEVKKFIWLNSIDWVNYSQLLSEESSIRMGGIITSEEILSAMTSKKGQELIVNTIKGRE